VDPQAVATTDHESCPPKIGQMPRRLRLRDFEALVNVAHANFTSRQETQDTEACAIGERFQQGFELSDVALHIFVLTDISITVRLLVYAKTYIGQGKTWKI
jgi:hypothetical protein